MKIRISLFSLLTVIAIGLLIARSSKASEVDDSNTAAVHKNLKITVDSTQLDEKSLDEKTEPKDKRVVFYSDKDSSVDINENGEPNLNMRF